MIGNHVYGNHRTRGSNPLLSAINFKNPVVFRQDFFNEE